MPRNLFERLFKSPEQPKVLDPARFKVELGSSPMAESGSRVYKGKKEDGSDCVFKVYSITPVTYEELEMYQRLSTETMRVLKDMGTTVKLKDANGNENEFQIETVPIEEIGVLPDGNTPCSVSEYIEGFNLDELVESEDLMSRFPEKYKGIKDSTFTKIFASGNVSEIKKTLAEISKVINEGLETEGVDLAPVNIKPLVTETGNILSVTDLYAQLERLKVDAARERKG